MHPMLDDSLPAPIRRIFFVNPPSGLYRRDDRCQSRVEDQTVRIIFPPIDLAQYAAVAREAGAEAGIGDYPARGETWEHLRSDLQQFHPDAVVFNITTATVREDIETAFRAKEVNPSVWTIARGELFEKQGEELFQQCPALDIALYGEIEDPLRRILSGEPPEQMEALLYRDRKSGEVRRNPGLPKMADLDSLPLPARDLLDQALYRSPETGAKLTVIQANRGCPARCIFCPAGEVSGFQLRLRSPDRIVAELRECVERFGIREFLFNGDTFTMRKKWVLELCEKIIESGLDIRWGCNSRVDTMDAERAEALHRAGCWVVAFGIESGNQEMLDRMKKGTRLEQAERALATCRKAGLATHAFFLIGLPWETPETLKETYLFARKLDPDFFDINIAYPLPGTELFAIAEKEGLLEDTRGSYAQAAMRTFAIAAGELTRWRKRALLKLYLRPGYILRTLRRAARTGTLPYYLKAALRRLKGLL